MKYEIMLRILFELLAKRKVSATDLAKKHEVTVRTVYRYVETLEMAGVPVERLRGANGGFSLLPEYRLAGGFLTREEYEATLSALNAVEGQLKSSVISSVIDKLKAGRNAIRDVSVTAGHLVIDASPWSDTAAYKDKLLTVSEALDGEKTLFIVYHDRNGETTEREIEPHVLAFKQGEWYVYAYCRKKADFRFFRVSRMAKIEKTGNAFCRREVAEPLPFHDWFTSQTVETVELSVKKDALADVEEWLGVENVYEKDGAYFARAELPVDKGLVAKILSFRGGVKVLSPKTLSFDVRSAATAVLNQE